MDVMCAEPGSRPMTFLRILHSQGSGNHGAGIAHGKCLGGYSSKRA